MAQIGVQYPNLASIFGESSVFPVEYGMQQFEGARQNEQLNQQQALQDMLFQEQNDPLKLQHQGLVNQGLEAGLPGIFANSSLSQDKANVSRQSLGEQIGAGKSKLAKDISDNDLGILENSAQRMAMSQNPEERAIGTMLLKQHKEIIRDREKQEAQGKRTIEQIQEQGKQARLTQQQAIDAGKFVKGSSGAKSIEDALASGKVGYEKAAAAYFSQAQQAYQGGDVEEGNRLMEIANQYNQQYIAGRQASVEAGQANKPDIGALTKGAVPTIASPTVNPFQPVVPRTIPRGNPGAQEQVRRDIEEGATFSDPSVEARVRAYANQGAPAVTQPKTMGDLQKLYPNFTQEQLRTAYKKKYGIDLK